MLSQRCRFLLAWAWLNGELKLAKKFDPFAQHRNNLKVSRIQHINKALATLSNGSYDKVTNLAHDVAKIIAEFERREFLLLPEAVQAEGFKPISFVTLLRNPEYRPLLDSVVFGKKTAQVVSSVSLSEFEALKARNAGLNGQIEQLKLTIRNLDAGIVPTTSAEVDLLRMEADKLRESLKLLFSIVDGMQTEGQGIYTTVLPGDQNPVYASPGFWGPMNQIATYDEMAALNKLREELERK